MGTGNASTPSVHSLGTATCWRSGSRSPDPDAPAERAEVGRDLVSGSLIGAGDQRMGLLAHARSFIGGSAAKQHRLGMAPTANRY
jgi:hypothetical protein